MSTFYLKVNAEGDALDVSLLHGDPSIKTEVKDIDELTSWLYDTEDKLYPDADAYEISFLCSSSLDFPEDFTKDAGIIALCDSIRG